MNALLALLALLATVSAQEYFPYDTKSADYNTVDNEIRGDVFPEETPVETQEPVEATPETDVSWYSQKPKDNDFFQQYYGGRFYDADKSKPYTSSKDSFEGFLPKLYSLLKDPKNYYGYGNRMPGYGNKYGYGSGYGYKKSYPQYGYGSKTPAGYGYGYVKKPSSYGYGNKFPTSAEKTGYGYGNKFPASFNSGEKTGYGYGNRFPKFGGEKTGYGYGNKFPVGFNSGEKTGYGYGNQYPKFGGEKTGYGYGNRFPARFDSAEKTGYGYGNKFPTFGGEKTGYGYGNKFPSYGYGNKFPARFDSAEKTGYGYGNKFPAVGSEKTGYGYGNKFPARFDSAEKTGYGYGNKFPTFGGEKTGYGYGNKFPSYGYGNKFPAGYGSAKPAGYGNKFPEYDVAKFNPFYDPKTTYDFESFSKYWKVNPIISKVYKYFSAPSKTFDETEVYFNVPYETVETFTQEKVLETVRELFRYYYNLPEDVRTTVDAKYPFQYVVKFLLRVYYNIPNNKYTLTPYYDIPSEVLSQLKTDYDLKKVIQYMVERYSSIPTEERELYNKYFDIVPVVRTLILSYYGVPKEVVRQLDSTFYNTPEYYKYVKTFFADREQLHKVIEYLVEKRNSLSDAEKFTFDKFLNIESLVRLFVKVYYDIPYPTDYPFYSPEGKRMPTELVEFLKKVFYTYNQEKTPKIVYDKYFNVPEFVKYVLKFYYGFPEQQREDYFDAVKAGIERYNEIPTEFRGDYDKYYNVPDIVKEILGRYYGDAKPYTYENVFKFMNKYQSVPETYRQTFDQYYNAPEYLSQYIKRFYGVPETTFGSYHPIAMKRVLDKYYGLDDESKTNFDKYFNVASFVNPKFAPDFYTKKGYKF